MTTMTTYKAMLYNSAPCLQRLGMTKHEEGGAEKAERWMEILRRRRNDNNTDNLDWNH